MAARFLTGLTATVCLGYIGSRTPGSTDSRPTTVGILIFFCGHPHSNLKSLPPVHEPSKLISTAKLRGITPRSSVQKNLLSVEVLEIVKLSYPKTLCIMKWQHSIACSIGSFEFRSMTPTPKNPEKLVWLTAFSIPSPKRLRS